MTTFADTRGGCATLFSKDATCVCDAIATLAGQGEDLQRPARLRADLVKQQGILDNLLSPTAILRDTLLYTRLRDRSAGIRLLAVAALVSLIQIDPVFYRSRPWPERIIRTICDPNADVRCCAIDAVAGWFAHIDAEETVALQREGDGPHVEYET